MAQPFSTPEELAQDMSRRIASVGGDPKQRPGESSQDWYARLERGGWFGEVLPGYDYFMRAMAGQIGQNMPSSTSPQTVAPTLPSYNSQAAQQTTTQLVQAQAPIQPYNPVTPQPTTPTTPTTPTAPTLPTYNTYSGFNRSPLLQGQYGVRDNSGNATPSATTAGSGGVANLPNLFDILSPYRKHFQT